MAALATGALFGPSEGGRNGEAPCSASHRTRYLSMFGSAPSSSSPDGETMMPRIHPGPPQPQIGIEEFTKRFGGGGHIGTRAGDLMRWKVVKESDAHRGFRMFDGILMSVKDVSSEELFLERMQIAYSAYEAYVAGVVDHSPFEITTALIRAVIACLVKYFSTQSMLRTNRPFIAKVLNLDCQDMFCSHSNFMESFLFTNASPEDEAIIALAQSVYAENNFNVCTDFSQPGGGGEEEQTSATDELFEFGMRIAERRIVGGTNASSLGGSRSKNGGSHFTTLSDDLPFQQRKDGDGQTLNGGTTAMLIVVTDFEALHNYVAYVLYLTPSQLTRRYNVNFDCLRRPAANAVNADCCRARTEAKKRKRDSAKVAIRAVIEKKRREKIDTMVERSAACELTLQRQNVHRNRDLLCHVLLMLFDKCLTGLIDKGFENLNTRRRYAVNSAKEIGAATIYTGIIDTVGEVSTNMEGYSFDSIMKSAAEESGSNEHAQQQHQQQQQQLRFSLPIVTEVTNSGVGGGGGSAN